MSINVLAGLLDEKLIRIMSLFLKYPDKKFYMSEVSKLSGVNNATTFRTLGKLVKEEFVKSVVIGKVRTYQLASGERARALAKLLKGKEGPKTSNKNPLSMFIEKIRTIQRIKLVLEESKTHNSAKLIIVGEFPSKERLERIAREIKEKTRFQINFVELNLSQYDGLKGTLGTDKKVLFKR